MYRKAEKMLHDFLQPIKDSIAYMLNTIEEAKQRVLNIPKMIMEVLSSLSSFIWSIVDGCKMALTNMAAYPVNIYIYITETVTQMVSFPFQVCFTAMSSTAMWLRSFGSSDDNQDKIQEETWARRGLQSCLQATEPMRTRAKNAIETVKDVCNDMPDASVTGGFRVVWWMLVWLVTTSMLGLWSAGLEKIKDIKTRFFDVPTKKVQRTYNEMHDYAEDLLGSVYVNVVKLHGEAKIFVESYSKIPANILVLVIRDRIRTHCRFNKVRQWLRNNAAIPLIIEDNVRCTVSKHTLSSDDSGEDVAVHHAGSVDVRARRRGSRRHR